MLIAAAAAAMPQRGEGERAGLQAAIAGIPASASQPTKPGYRKVCRWLAKVASSRQSLPNVLLNLPFLVRIPTSNSRSLK